MFEIIEKKIKRRHLRLGLLLAVFCICSFFAGAVQAEDAAAPPPYDQEGSITVAVKDNTVAVPGGTLTIYRIADVVSDNGYWYAFTDEFKGFITELTQKYSSSYKPEYIAESVFPGELTKLAADLQAYINTEKIEGDKRELGETGSISFDKLKAGLYLFIQEDAAAGYYAIKPFLVSLPGKDTDGNDVWKVDAGPKAEVLPREKQPDPVSVNPKISKQVVMITDGKTQALDNKNLPEDTSFDFVFGAEDSSYPMPKNAKGSVKNGGPVVSQSGTAMQLRVNGIGTIDVGTITFTEEGEYYYTVEELPPDDTDFTRDTRVYSLVYFVKKSADGTKLEVTGEVHDGDANGKLLEKKNDPTLLFTNTYKPTIPGGPTPTTPPGGNVPSGKLPQTGQLWWPIWLLAGVGILLIAVGIAVKKHGNKV